jgi:Na+-transporting methylmalonyl-CoA/oxaloacetate decarboxylase gamma subunit
MNKSWVSMSSNSATNQPNINSDPGYPEQVGKRVALAFMRFVGTMMALLGYFVMTSGGTLFPALYLLVLGLALIVLSFPEVVTAIWELRKVAASERTGREPFGRLRIPVLVFGVVIIIVVVAVWGVTIGFYLLLLLVLALIVMGEIDFSSRRREEQLESESGETEAPNAPMPSGAGEPVPEEPAYEVVIPPSHPRKSHFADGPRFCPECGTTNPQDYSYCQKCGAPLPLPV